MRNLLKILLLFISLLIAQSFMYAATQGIFGSEVLTDDNGNKQVYSKICLQTEFEIWKIGIGFDLQLYLDENGNGREEDWDSWSDAVDKILYVRYGQKGEPIYINFSGIRAATIGHGIIFNRYSNMIRYPEVRKVGLVFDMNTPSFGIETIVTNLIREEVFGGRFYFKPFYSSGMFLLDQLAFGVSAGTDVDPDDNEQTKDDDVSIAAADVELPLIDNPVFSATAFADMAQMQIGDRYLTSHNYYDISAGSTKTAHSENNGTGFMTGFLGKLLFLDYKVIYKKLDANFIDGYFNPFYEVERCYKGNTIFDKTLPKKEGYYGELGYTLMDKISILASYEDLNNDNNEKYPWVHAELSVDKSLLANKFFFNFSYDKKDAQNWEEIKDIYGKNSLMKTELGYAVSGDVMLVFCKEQTYDSTGEPTTKTSIKIRIIF